MCASVHPFVCSFHIQFVHWIRDHVSWQKTRSRFRQRWQRDIQTHSFTACQRSYGKIMFSIVFICLSVRGSMCPLLLMPWTIGPYMDPPHPWPCPCAGTPGTASAHSSLSTGIPWWLATEAYTVGERTACILLECFLVTACKQSLGQGNVFTPVCHSVHRREGVCLQGFGCRQTLGDGQTP